MSAALELIQTVQANGGLLRVEGDALVIAPDSAGLPVIDELREHKGEIIRLLENRPAVPPHDPAEWREPFALWLDSACARHSRVSGGVTALHLAYCEWEIARDGVPCSRETFETLLAELGFLLGEIEGVMLVSGVTFRNDVEAAGLSA